MTNEPPRINVRGVPAYIWDALHIEAVRRHTPIGALLTEALRAWLEANTGGAEK